MATNTYIAVGRIIKAHGIRGEVSVDFHAESPRILDGPVFLQQGNAEPVQYTVATQRKSHGGLLLRFAEIPDRTAAEPLRGRTLLVPESRLPRPSEGEIYLHHILGLTVIAPSSGGGERVLGRIAAVAAPAGQELWTIAQDGEEDILFPAVPEFVLDIDPAKGEARICPPPGLVELYRS